MKIILTTGAALLMTTGMAHAVGLDRSNQNIGVLFEDTGATGSYVELSYGFVMPDLSGVDSPISPLLPSGSESGNVADDYGIFGMGFKHQYTDQFSAALILDQPYGASIAYPVGQSLNYGGTGADLDSKAVTVLGRYEMDNGFSVHGGVRMQTISADVDLRGFGFQGLNGYSVSLDDDTAAGYVVGAAYERPDIALRVAITYFSEIDHSFATSETLNGAAVFGPSADTDVSTPQAINLDFQTGVAAGTLVFGQIRYADYDKVVVSPNGFDAVTPTSENTSLVGIASNFSYSLGVGRQITDNFAGSLTVGYEPDGDDLVSPLGPTNGNYSVALGGAYTFDNGMELSGGVRYVKAGDADVGSDPVQIADFENNDAVAVGLKIAYAF